MEKCFEIELKAISTSFFCQTCFVLKTKILKLATTPKAQNSQNMITSLMESLILFSGDTKG